VLTVKLNKKDVVKTINDTLTLFRTGIKSEKTRETYEIILHVDNSPEICQMNADMLALGNHTVKSVNDGREGLELVLKNDYDLILLDLCMPRYSGMDFIHDLKAKRPMGLYKLLTSITSR